MASSNNPKKMKKKILSALTCWNVNVCSDSDSSMSTHHMNTSNISTQSGDRNGNDYELQNLAAAASSEPLNEDSVDLVEDTSSTMPRNRNKTFIGDPDDDLMGNDNESFKLFEDSCIQRNYGSEEDSIDENENVEDSFYMSDKTYEEAFSKNCANLPVAPPLPKSLSDSDSTPFQPTEEDITKALMNNGIFVPKPPKSIEKLDDRTTLQDIQQNKAQETYLNLNLLLDRNLEGRNNYSEGNQNESNTLEQQEPEKIPSPSSEEKSQTESDELTIKNPASTRNQIFSKDHNQYRNEGNESRTSAKESEPNLEKSISRISNSLTDEESPDTENENENEELPIEMPPPTPITVQVQAPANDNQIVGNEAGTSSQGMRNEAGTSEDGEESDISPVVNFNHNKNKKPKIMLPKKVNKSRLVINSSESESEAESPSTSGTSSPSLEKSKVEQNIVETILEKKRKSSAKYFLAIKKSLTPKSRNTPKKKILIKKPQFEMLLKVYHNLNVKKEQKFVSNLYTVWLEYLEIFLKTLQDNCADPSGIYTFKELEKALLAEKLISAPGELQWRMASLFNHDQMQKMISNGLYPI